MAIHACNSAIGRQKEKGWDSKVILLLYTELETSLGYVRPHLKQTKKKCNFQNTVENKKLTAGKRQVQTDFDVFQREEVQYLDIETNVKGRKEQSFHCSSWKLCLQMKGMCLS